MPKDRIITKVKFPNVLILLSIILLSCASLIFINYFTIKILSANRAYVNGESHYSKGQKDAVHHLTTYLYSGDSSQWKRYLEELSVPQGDGLARIRLINNSDIDSIKAALRAGRNHEEDLNDMIWLFRNFNFVPFFKKAIHEWEQGDALINQIAAMGNKVHEKMQPGGMSDPLKMEFLAQISDLSEKLTINERNFSNTLGEGTREIKDYLIYTNMIFILIIICSVGIYYAAMVKKLLHSQHEIEDKNSNLMLANKELDKFVYSASHDLRSPITSLKGLVEILKLEDDPAQIAGYLDLMQEVLTKQDQFISDIIDYSRNKKTETTIEPVSLKEIVDDAIVQHQYMEKADKITVEKDMFIDTVMSDPLRLKIIIHNLYSNAIKYADFQKPEPYIKIRTFAVAGNNVITIQDNGIGINRDFQDRIFDMFFVTNSNKGTGLGLYIVKEAVENIGAAIEVQSEIGTGTIFTVTIPLRNET